MLIRLLPFVLLLSQIASASPAPDRDPILRCPLGQTKYLLVFNLLTRDGWGTAREIQCVLGGVPEIETEAGVLQAETSLKHRLHAKSVQLVFLHPLKY